MRAKNKIFHLECFRCVACDKQLVPGDEFALRPDGLVCKEDHAQISENSFGTREENNNNQDSTQDDLEDEDDNSQDGDKDLLMDDRHDRYADSGELFTGLHKTKCAFLSRESIHMTSISIQKHLIFLNWGLSTTAHFFIIRKLKCA